MNDGLRRPGHLGPGERLILLVRKPVDFNVFLQIIADLGSYWLEFNQPLPRGV